MPGGNAYTEKSAGELPQLIGYGADTARPRGALADGELRFHITK